MTKISSQTWTLRLVEEPIWANSFRDLSNLEGSSRTTHPRNETSYAKDKVLEVLKILVVSEVNFDSLMVYRWLLACISSLVRLSIFTCMLRHECHKLEQIGHRKRMPKQHPNQTITQLHFIYKYIWVYLCIYLFVSTWNLLVLLLHLLLFLCQVELHNSQ